MPYLLVTDLDGTLLRADGTVSLRTRQALRRARTAGLPVVFATGRPPRWLPAVLDQTGHCADIICTNGALILDESDRELRVRAISEEDANRASSALQAVDGRFVFRTEMWQGHILKLLAFVPGGDPAHADELLRRADAALAGVVNATHSSLTDLLIEMSAATVTKAEALDALIDLRGWHARTVVAVGDMPNDRPLLERADVAVTVRTGHHSLRPIVDRVLPGPDEDGVAGLIEDLLSGV